MQVRVVGAVPLGDLIQLLAVKEAEQEAQESSRPVLALHAVHEHILALTQHSEGLHHCTLKVILIDVDAHLAPEAHVPPADSTRPQDSLTEQVANCSSMFQVSRLRQTPRLLNRTTHKLCFNVPSENPMTCVQGAWHMWPPCGSS